MYLPTHSFSKTFLFSCHSCASSPRVARMRLYFSVRSEPHSQRQSLCSSVSCWKRWLSSSCPPLGSARR